MRESRLPPVVAAGAFAVGAIAVASPLPAVAQEEPPMPEPVAPELEARIDAIHERFVFADIHAHPSRFHRANVERISPAEVERYLRGSIDVAVANVSTDAAYSGGYVRRDGSRVDRGPRPRPAPGEPFDFTLDRVDRVLKTIEDDDRVVLAASPGAVLRAREEGKLALMPALEGGDGLDGSVDNLRALHRKGVRLLQIVHFRANELGHIQTYPYSPGGLTDFGRAAIREANRLGIVVDLAHANTETIMDALEVSEDPVLFSHTATKALADGDRLLTDDEIRAIARHGGVVGIWPNGSSVASIDDMIRHIDHVREVAGIDHVGIGSDLRGLGRYAEGFDEEANFHALAAALLEHGYTAIEVGKVMGGNFFRVWEETADEP